MYRYNILPVNNIMNYYVEFSQDIRVNCATDNSNYYHIQKKVDTRVLVIINKLYKISFHMYM